MSDPHAYERLGVGYTSVRGEEPQIAAAIHGALGVARTVVNVGAGTGSYEPRDREVTAVEPSAQMRAQRPAGAAPAIDGRAEALPFADDAFDGVARLRADLVDGTWARRHGDLLALNEIDLGYRLLVSTPTLP